MTEPAQQSSPEDLAKQVMPSVLELQKLLVERTRRALPDGGDVAVVSVTSCNHHSCLSEAEAAPQ
ncbi:hypothetical protein [Kitasatospora sp. NPDC093102]|uniref:hypothetical protein n=1 Tax=Kitasatospora sp. NPDC093102 TaxID=3155069 RepID=UPI0034192BEF